MIKLKLPSVFTRFTDKLEVDVHIETGKVKDVINKYLDTEPILGSKIRTMAGDIRSDVFRVGVNGALCTPEQNVKSGDTIRIILATSGG